MLAAPDVEVSLCITMNCSGSCNTAVLRQQKVKDPGHSAKSCNTPVLPQQHVEEPGHAAKSASGRLQLSTHAPYVRMF